MSMGRGYFNFLGGGVVEVCAAQKLTFSNELFIAVYSDTVCGKNCSQNYLKKIRGGGGHVAGGGLSKKLHFPISCLFL